MMFYPKVGCLGFRLWAEIAGFVALFLAPI